MNLLFKISITMLFSIGIIGMEKNSLEEQIQTLIDGKIKPLMPVLKEAYNKAEKSLTYTTIIEEICKDLKLAVLQVLNKERDPDVVNLVDYLLNLHLLSNFSWSACMVEKAQDTSSEVDVPLESRKRKESEKKQIQALPVDGRKEQHLVATALKEKRPKTEGRNAVNTLLLIAAVKEHNSQLLNLLIEQGTNVNGRDEQGRTALMHACALGYDAEAQTLLLEGNADISLIDNNGNSALFFAAGNGHASLVRMLIEIYNMKADSKNRAGIPLLVLAALNGHLAVVCELLKLKPDVSIPDEGGHTPLMAAVISGNEKLVHVLIEAGSSLNACNGDGETALLLALKAGLGLIKKADAGRQSLCEQYKNIALMLARAGADLYVTNKSNLNALLLAQTYPEETFLPALLEASAQK